MKLFHRTLQMLAAIEGKLEELFEITESLPVEKVEAAEKVSPGSCFFTYLIIIAWLVLEQ